MRAAMKASEVPGDANRRSQKERKGLPAMVALGMLGTAAGVAWLWNRRGETALETRTAQRLRPKSSNGPGQ